MNDLAGAMRLYMITDDSGRKPKDLALRVQQGIDGGVTAVQFREKNCGPTSCAQGFEAVANVCANAGIPLFLNADLLGRIELNGPLAGIHYSDRTLPSHSKSKEAITGFSAHAVDDAVKAFGYDVDFCTLSPIYPTPSKAGILGPVGTKAIRDTRKVLPGKILVALGGIDETNAGDCMEAGASGIAVIRAIICAEFPAKAAFALSRIVEKHIGT